MGSIPIVGKAFATAAAFLDYLDDLQLGAWRPNFITMHHTGAPDLKTWDKWEKRGNPSDEQWTKNLAKYYGDLGWSSGPHFFVTPRPSILVLSPPTKRGVHAASFNSVSWGVEVVGNFDVEKLTGSYREFVVDAIAAMHVALGASPAPFRKGVSGMHFHRDDPKTKKTCPGKSIDKVSFSKEVDAAIKRLTPGSQQHEIIAEKSTAQKGFVRIPDGETLNVRGLASAKGPVVRTLQNNEMVVIHGQALNGDTAWWKIGDDEWVAARYIELS
jgi:hypothetical protein